MHLLTVGLVTLATGEKYKNVLDNVPTKSFNKTAEFIYKYFLRSVINLYFVIEALRVIVDYNIFLSKSSSFKAK